tara:strand:+ start:881 stop:1171 length:291 start_codon:yes stop_codon:yes gene_type:complete
MGVPFHKIEELIEVCKKVDEKKYDDDWDKRIHVRDIQATLQKLIDDELQEMEEMAQRFQDEDDGMTIRISDEELNEVSEQYEAVRSQRKSDWPHGL